MKLFESTWRENYKCYERFFDTELGESVRREIDLPCEWYEEYSRGLYTSILDENVKLDKKQGNAKDGRQHYGFLDPMYRNIRDNYWNKDSYNLTPRIWWLDIETRVGTASTGFPVPEKAAEPISMFQIFDNKSNTMILLGLRDWKHQNDYKYDFPVKYMKCKDEIALINTFLDIFRKLDPLVIYAWNGLGFDFPYIYNRMKKLGMDTNRLSNYGKTSLKEGEFQGRIDFKFKSDGHFFVDLMQVYDKFTFAPVPSLALDTIAEIELGENKVEHSEYSDFDSMYSSKNYNIVDEPYDDPIREEIRQKQINRKNLKEEFARRGLGLPKHIQ